ncbi:MAG: caspase family protein [Deltaproteobacteria bacterium]|nr:caspase family protein [Deltaproteobacteria bacterium]
MTTTHLSRSHLGEPRPSRRILTPSLAIVLGSSLLLMPTIAASAGAGPASVPTRPAAYALIVGTNQGGPGQKTLRYAHKDATRVKAVLQELGGYTSDHIDLLLDPTRENLLVALRRANQRLAAAKSAGHRPLFVFYYSGHARARALNLGKEELPLAILRTRLLALPATATVAILDACQTGAISGIKGATPAADFSYNSAQDLETAGVAVLASSAASELSQEADTLHASYFTHNLLVGLRGAADRDDNGRVTLAEAYHYAYDRTLIATAKTAVGRQHVTLETRMRGKGALVLTYPAEANASLVLPKSLAGEILVHHAPARFVLAELHKAPGQALRLALPPGRYVALLRPSAKTTSAKTSAKKPVEIHRCALTLAAHATTTLKLADCTLERPTPVVTKGARTYPDIPGPPRLALEIGVGFFFGGQDAYDTRLESFGFSGHEGFIFPNVDPTLSVAATWAFSPYLAIGARFTMLDGAHYTRTLHDLSGDDRVETFDWSTYGVGIFLRGSWPFFDGIVAPFIQAGAGLAWTTTTLIDPIQASPVQDDETQWGYLISGSIGLSIMPWRHVGFFGQLDYDYAKAMKNLVGNTHDSGGARLLFGLRGAI